MMCERVGRTFGDGRRVTTARPLREALVLGRALDRWLGAAVNSAFGSRSAAS